MRPHYYLRRLSWLSLLVTVLVTGCAADALWECRQREQAGEFLFESNNACGCELRACSGGTRCFQGQCCDPIVERSNPRRCGCSAVCGPTELCQQGRCCDPRIDPTCACDVNEHLNDDLYCGCRGTCPVGSVCRNGVCGCQSAGSVLCDVESNPPWGRCTEQSACLCKRTQHLNDSTNCGCSGPCGNGDRCSSGACSCDALAHAQDNLNCGCQGPCAVGRGFVCKNGACLCDPVHQSNSLNCGCTGTVCDTARGIECRGGSCLCPPERLYDSTNCACVGPCLAGDICNNGRCVKPGL